MAINTIRDLKNKIKSYPEEFYIIHYSCQSLNDDNEGLSPRITSIAVTHYATEQTVSFSTHFCAEMLKFDKDTITNNLDLIEKQLLKEFYDYVRDRKHNYWIHWNMRNAVFGFEHLERRYRALGGTDYSIIPVEQRLNLNEFLNKKYGDGYASHPKMRDIMDLNGGNRKDFLTGEEEVQSFQNKDYIKLHKSTLCKVGLFHSLLKKMLKGTLKTRTKGLGVKFDAAYESRMVKIISFAGNILGLILTVYTIYTLIIRLFFM